MQSDLKFEARICALSLLANIFMGTLSGSNQCKREFLGFMTCRFNLTDSQKAWCGELLDFRNGFTPIQSAENILYSAGGLLTNEDLRLLERVFSWIQGVDAGDLASERDVSGLFPGSVLESFRILGICPTFISKDVRSAFRNKISAFHPDRAGLVADREGQCMAIHIVSARDEVLNYYTLLREEE